MTALPMSTRRSDGTRSKVRPSLEAFFSYGFRPFFLAAGIYAALAMTIWLAWIVTSSAGMRQDWLPVAGSPFAWHAHEMVFGFTAAAIGGFLLTAVPNWTGALPLSGAPLVVLFSIWLVGRIAMALSALLPYPVVAALDVAFLPVLGAFAARQLFVRPAPRNLIFLAIVAALTLCNIGYHSGNSGYLVVDPLAAIRISVLIVIVMIAVIGGRIIPAFTHNWLNMQRQPETQPGAQSGRMPMRIPWVEKTALISLVIFAAVEAAGVSDILSGIAAAIAALANGARLALWRGLATRSEPIVWILHIAYAWITVGLVLSAVSSFGDASIGAIATHAFGTGAVGTMILAVMSRACLGHTGRRIVASRLIVWAYYLVTLAALLRIGAPLVAPQHGATILTAAALSWICAFAIFAVVYAPILTTPRVHTKLDRT